MEIQLTPEQEHTLAQFATNQGKKADTLAVELIGHYLDDQNRFITAVKLGEEELERSEYLTSEQVGAHIAQFFTS